VTARPLALHRPAFVVALALAFQAVVACARPPPPPTAPPPKLAAPVADRGEARPDTAPPHDEVPSLDVLASRGPCELPLMREVLRSSNATTPSVLAAGSGDACFRAVIAASAPVRAWFEDEARAVRGVELTGSSGLVPPRGPACARRGESLRLVVEPASAAVTARAVVWRAP
jgi:hypothetical protein